MRKNLIIMVTLLILIGIISFFAGYKFAEKNFTNLPDLIVTDITHEGPYIYVHYMNQGFVGSKGDFLIKISAEGKSFEGNAYYRFKIPEPGEETKTGGFTIGLIGLEKDMTSIVTAEIDWENRVDERNENNNVFHKQISIK